MFLVKIASIKGTSLSRKLIIQFSFRNYTHILIGTQGGMFENMFLVKIASKGTSLSGITYHTGFFQELYSHIDRNSGEKV